MARVVCRAACPGCEFLLCHKFNAGFELGKRSVHCVLRQVKGMLGRDSCQVMDSACQISFSEEFIFSLVTGLEKVRDPPMMWECRLCRIRWLALASAEDRVFVHSGQLREWRLFRDLTKVTDEAEA